MQRSFKYRLYPNKNQMIQLDHQVETLRRVYNEALQVRKDCWELWGEGVTSKTQHERCISCRRQKSKTRNCAKCRKIKIGEIELWQNRRNKAVSSRAEGGFERYWLAEVAAVSVRDTLNRLDKAFQSFFERCKSGGKPGYPRYKPKNRDGSIPFENTYPNGCVLSRPDGSQIFGDHEDELPRRGCHLRIRDVGKIRILIHRSIKGKIKTAVVKREGNKWFVSFSCVLEGIKVEPSTKPPIGIDLGITRFVTTSNGHYAENPKYLIVTLPELRRRQKSASRKWKKGIKTADQSNRWRKACKRVAKLYARVKNLRKEHHYQIALKLIHRYGFIALEDLSVKSMVKNRRLARAISDVAWSSFVAILKHKAESAGVGWTKINPAYTSQTCSRCGHCEENNRLTQEKFHCLNCGLTMNADHNAAKNILVKALKMEPGSGLTGVSPTTVGFCPKRTKCVTNTRTAVPREVPDIRPPPKAKKGSRSRKTT